MNQRLINTGPKANSVIPVATPWKYSQLVKKSASGTVKKHAEQNQSLPPTRINSYAAKLLVHSETVASTMLQSSWEELHLILRLIHLNGWEPSLLRMVMKRVHQISSNGGFQRQLKLELIAKSLAKKQQDLNVTVALNFAVEHTSWRLQIQHRLRFAAKARIRNSPK